MKTPKKKTKKVKEWQDLSSTEVLVRKPIVVDWSEPLHCIKNVGGKKKEWEIPVSRLLDYVWLTEPHD